MWERKDEAYNVVWCGSDDISSTNVDGSRSHSFSFTNLAGKTSILDLVTLIGADLVIANDSANAYRICIRSFVCIIWST